MCSRPWCAALCHHGGPGPRFHRHDPISGCDRDCRCDRDAPVQPPDRARQGQWEDSNALCSYDTVLPSASLVRCPSPSVGNGETGFRAGWHAACTPSVRLRCWQEGELPPLRRNPDHSHPPLSFQLSPEGAGESICAWVSPANGGAPSQRQLGLRYRTYGRWRPHAPAGMRNRCAPCLPLAADTTFWCSRRQRQANFFRYFGSITWTYKNLPYRQAPLGSLCYLTHAVNCSAA